MAWYVYILIFALFMSFCLNYSLFVTCRDLKAILTSYNIDPFVTQGDDDDGNATDN